MGKLDPRKLTPPKRVHFEIENLEEELVRVDQEIVDEGGAYFKIKKHSPVKHSKKCDRYSEMKTPRTQETSGGKKSHSKVAHID